MAVPIFGAIFIPIAIFVFLFRPQYLVSLMVVASVFAGASVLDVSVGDSVFGLQPYYFVAALLAVRAVPFLLGHRHVGRGLDPTVDKIHSSLVHFWLWATVSAFLFPVIFRGVKVIDPRLGVEDVLAAMALEGEATPLHWSLGNLGQAVYLTLSVIALLYVLKCADRGNSRQALKALRAAILIVAVIALLQSVAAWRGWDFPYIVISALDARGLYVRLSIADASIAGRDSPQDPHMLLLKQRLMSEEALRDSDGMGTLAQDTGGILDEQQRSGSRISGALPPLRTLITRWHSPPKT